MDEKGKELTDYELGLGGASFRWAVHVGGPLDGHVYCKRCDKTIRPEDPDCPHMVREPERGQLKHGHV